jgi:hypothetical protein
MFRRLWLIHLSTVKVQILDLPNNVFDLSRIGLRSAYRMYGGGRLQDACFNSPILSSFVEAPARIHHHIFILCKYLLSRIYHHVYFSSWANAAALRLRGKRPLDKNQAFKTTTS